MGCGSNKRTEKSTNNQIVYNKLTKIAQKDSRYENYAISSIFKVSNISSDLLTKPFQDLIFTQLNNHSLICQIKDEKTLLSNEIISLSIKKIQFLISKFDLSIQIENNNYNLVTFCANNSIDYFTTELSCFLLNYITFNLSTEESKESIINKINLSKTKIIVVDFDKYNYLISDLDDNCQDLKLVLVLNTLKDLSNSKLKRLSVLSLNSSISSISNNISVEQTVYSSQNPIHLIYDNNKLEILNSNYYNSQLSFFENGLKLQYSNLKNNKEIYLSSKQFHTIQEKILVYGYFIFSSIIAFNNSDFLKQLNNIEPSIISTSIESINNIVKSTKKTFELIDNEVKYSFLIQSIENKRKNVIKENQHENSFLDNNVFKEYIESVISDSIYKNLKYIILFISNRIDKETLIDFISIFSIPIICIFSNNNEGIIAFTDLHIYSFNNQGYLKKDIVINTKIISTQH